MDQDIVRSGAEAAKATAEASGKLIDLVRSFGGLFREPAEQVAGMLTDYLAFVRWKNLQRLGDKVEAIKLSRGITSFTRKLPLKFSLPLLGHATLEEDDELQQVWARLLVNAGDASTEIELRSAYVDMLAGMSAFDVRNLAEMAKITLDVPDKGYPPLVQTWNLPKFAKLADADRSGHGNISKEVGVSLSNLCRLGCIVPGSGSFGGVALFHLMAVTDLGRAFYKACA